MYILYLDVMDMGVEGNFCITWHGIVCYHAWGKCQRRLHETSRAMQNSDIDIRIGGQ